METHTLMTRKITDIVQTATVDRDLFDFLSGSVTIETFVPEQDKKFTSVLIEDLRTMVSEYDKLEMGGKVAVIYNHYHSDDQAKIYVELGKLYAKGFTYVHDEGEELLLSNAPLLDVPPGLDTSDVYHYYQYSGWKLMGLNDDWDLVPFSNEGDSEDEQ